MTKLLNPRHTVAALVASAMIAGLFVAGAVAPAMHQPVLPLAHVPA